MLDKIMFDGADRAFEHMGPHDSRMHDIIAHGSWFMVHALTSKRC